MNKYLPLYACFFMLQSTSIFAKFYSSQHSMTTSTMIMNGKKFTHTKKSDNGDLSEQFSINDVPVEQDDFNHELNTLKLAQMNHDEKEAQRKADEQENMKQQLKIAMLEKLVLQSLDDLKQTLSTLQESILNPYLMFHHSGISSAAELEALSTWTEQLHKNLKSKVLNQNMTSLQNLSQELETKLEMARLCLKQSMQYATSHCDDTATLKKLLNLIEA